MEKKMEIFMMNKTKVIMDYWYKYAYKDSKSDYMINCLLENFCKAKKADYIPSDIYKTVDKLSIKNKISLIKLIENIMN